MMQRELVSSGAVWEPVVGHSRAVRVGPWVSVAGTTAAAEGGGVVGGDDIGAQAHASCWTSSPSGRCGERMREVWPL